MERASLTAACSSGSVMLCALPSDFYPNAFHPLTFLVSVGCPRAGLWAHVCKPLLWVFTAVPSASNPWNSLGTKYILAKWMHWCIRFFFSVPSEFEAAVCSHAAQSLKGSFSQFSGIWLLFITWMWNLDIFGTFRIFGVLLRHIKKFQGLPWWLRG